MISDEQLKSVGEWLETQGQDPNLEQALRAAFPAMHFTFCADDDVMSDHPAAELGTFNLYLVDSSNHCLCLTRDMEQASGLVVAECEAD